MVFLVELGPRLAMFGRPSEKHHLSQFDCRFFRFWIFVSSLAECMRGKLNVNVDTPWCVIQRPCLFLLTDNGNSIRISLAMAESTGGQALKQSWKVRKSSRMFEF